LIVYSVNSIFFKKNDLENPILSKEGG
jgi:hypothetical protein